MNFLDRVAATRKMPKNEVRKIAEGRIYTGRQAITSVWSGSAQAV